MDAIMKLEANMFQEGFIREKLRSFLNKVLDHKKQPICQEIEEEKEKIRKKKEERRNLPKCD
jgi:glutamyl-tRNA reductase